MHIFCLVLLYSLQVTYPGLDYVITFVMAGLSVKFVWSQSRSLAVLSLFLYLAVSIVCPVWFYKLQSLKNNIHGPWDEATIQD
eukprot:m.113774 g.113774  ORF g.113774 m.113774 type:complete len:83 (+) comp37463_c0_seq4:551-799(+)